MFERALERIADGLTDAGIPYMVIGGQAVLLYGEPRLTKDIDITLGVGPEQVADLVRRIPAMRLKALVEPEPFVEKTLVLPCQDLDSPVRVDFIFTFSPYERQAIERARVVRVGDSDVRFASPEDLVIHKIVSGRARDHDDVKSVLAKNPDVDIDYIRQWLHYLTETLDLPLTDQFEELRDQAS